MITDYLQSTRKHFEYYQGLGDRTFEQLTDEQLFWQYNDDSNSIATIVKHLSGNMLSRWTDFLTTDGEKDWRNRDAEFENDITDRTELMAKWNAGWACLFTNFDTINEDNIDTIIYIRNVGHNITDAVIRQLCHCTYHVGQIVFIGKMVKDGHWTSLTIPKGASQQFNAEKFGQPKS